MSAPTDGAIAIDGEFEDWTFPTQIDDARGDGTEQGLDFRGLWVSDQDDTLMLRLEVGCETAALQPDLVALQEVEGWPTITAEACFDDSLPLPDSGAWSATAAGDTMIVSRWRIDEIGSVGDNNIAARVRAPGRNLVLISVHTPCCANEEGRDQDHRRIAEEVRNMLAGSGLFVVDQRTPVVVAGDFNLVGFRRQREVIERLADWSPDGLDRNLTPVRFRHTHSREVYTWRNDESDFAPGRLDWVFYTADRIAARRAFVLWTPDIPAAALTAAGLAREDSRIAADHLVLVTDFAYQRQ